MKIGFGIGIEYQTPMVIRGITGGGGDEENVWRFDDNTDILWEDETQMITEE